MKRFNQYIYEAKRGKDYSPMAMPIAPTVKEDIKGKLSPIFQELYDLFTITDITKLYHNIDSDYWTGSLSDLKEKQGVNEIVYSFYITFDLTDINLSLTFYEILSHISNGHKIELSKAREINSDVRFKIWYYSDEKI